MLVVTAANGQPALAAYLPDGTTDECPGYGIMVFAIAGEAITTIVGVPDPDLFPFFDLPLSRQAT